jgi:phosphatidylserine/phosphatidylglycerophosphate/cardiolipin synthase-like enzyme
MSKTNRDTNPTRIDLGAIRSREGYFLSRPAEQKPFIPAPTSDNATWQFCSTFRDSPTTLRDAVLKLIRNARHKIFVTSYILGDDELIDTLTASADRLTGGVYLISELSERSLRNGLADLADKEAKGKEIGQEVEAAKKRFESLTSRGVAVRGHENCHAKFIVVDDSIAWIGSANLDTRAFTKVGEVGVVTTNSTEVDRLARLFAQMWLAECNREMPNTPSDYFAHQREGTPVSFTIPATAVAPQPTALWTNDTEQTLLANIHETITNAKQRILLASFSLTGMRDRHDLLLTPLATAIAKGVSVEMLVRNRNHLENHRRDAHLLQELGVNLVADQLNHAKAVVADDQSGLLFSANFDAQHGLDAGSGIEVGARLDGTPALHELARYLRHALDNATHRYIPNPTSRQLNETLNADWQHPWPLLNDITVQADQQTWHQLATGSSQGPVLWTRRNNNSVELIAGHSRLQLHPSSNAVYHLKPLSPAGRPAHEELTSWWKDRSTSHHRGYCPAVIKLDTT